MSDRALPPILLKDQQSGEPVACAPTDPRFPVLDADRSNRFGYFVLTEYGYIDMCIDETDKYRSAPLRLAYDCDAGLHLELGPYSLVDDELQRVLERLKLALNELDAATTALDALRDLGFQTEQPYPDYAPRSVR